MRELQVLELTNFGKDAGKLVVVQEEEEQKFWHRPMTAKEQFYTPRLEYVELPRPYALAAACSPTCVSPVLGTSDLRKPSFNLPPAEASSESIPLHGDVAEEERLQARKSRLGALSSHPLPDFSLTSPALSFSMNAEDDACAFSNPLFSPRE